MPEGRTLYRSRTERMVAGVCGGIAEYFDLDPTVVRLIAVVITVVGNAAAVVAYLVLWAVVPEKPLANEERPAPPAASAGAASNVQATTTEPAPRSAPIPPSAPPPAPPFVPVAPQSPAPPVPPARAAAPASRRSSGRSGVAWFGAILVAIGGALMADILFPALDIWGFWPLTVAGLVVIALGIRMIFSSGGER